MIRFLRGLFALVLALMLWVTLRASLERGVFAATADLWRDAWFRATLADAYCGFLAVFVWIAWRERTAAARVAWFVALAALGNLAIATYFLLALFRLAPGDSVDRLFARKPSLSGAGRTAG